MCFELHAIIVRIMLLLFFFLTISYSRLSAVTPLNYPQSLTEENIKKKRKKQKANNSHHHPGQAKKHAKLGS